MTILIIISIISFIGIGVVIWMLKNDKGSTEEIVEKINLKDLEKKNLPDISKKIIKDKKSFFNLKTAEIKKEIPQTLTEKKVNVDKRNVLNEDKNLKIKYERLEKLFKEKSEVLERVQLALDNELKNKKDFDKVKDIIEKDAQEVKARIKESQDELNALKQEKEKKEKEVFMLEEKVLELKATLKKFKESEISNGYKAEENTIKVVPADKPREGFLDLSTPAPTPPPVIEKKHPIPIIDDVSNADNDIIRE